MPSAGITPISTQTTTGSVASINFTSIPSTYTHLKLVVNCTGISGFESLNLRVGNNSYDSAANYSYLAMINDGSVAKANQGNAYEWIYGPVSDGNQPIMAMINFWNYASTNMFKTITVEGGNATSGPKYISKNICTWRNTVAINQISITPPSVTINSGTTATLFGITGV
jgi:hypothetical protein